MNKENHDKNRNGQQNKECLFRTFRDMAASFDCRKEEKAKSSAEKAPGKSGEQCSDYPRCCSCNAAGAKAEDADRKFCFFVHVLSLLTQPG
ncbi:MAG TPA: hypothetical protein DGX96_06760 [Lachnospiraceae bacterium]|nr:hypothetical protein [Lachnospiraceae bacterium]